MTITAGVPQQRTAPFAVQIMKLAQALAPETEGKRSNDTSGSPHSSEYAPYLGFAVKSRLKLIAFGLQARTFL
jgi:hypothetical protein